MRVYPLLGACALTALAAPVMAQDSATETAFDLGRIVVLAPAPAADTAEIGASTLGQEAIERFRRDALDDAVKLIPGVSASNSGGSRNERLVFVRGFDRFQVPLSIDGIRVYLPADNRLDYGRFLTPDVAEIQVAKGYASVLDGPGALGGAINLVTRKPTKPLEVDFRAVANLDRETEVAGSTFFGLVGTRQDNWFAQASFARNDTDHWSLSDDFVPTATEDGGERDFSKTEDWRLNLKAGYTPNASDEYTLSYTRQEGSKNAPFHVTSPQAQSWTWPYWNLESLYFLSTTALSDSAALKLKAYRNSFDNLLRGWDNRNQNTQTLTAGRVFNSWYEDEAYGGSVQVDYTAGAHGFGVSAHYRRDEHVEYQQVFPTGFIEPPQANVEDTFSLAAEDRLALSSAVTLTLGFGYDWRNLKQADEFVLNSTRDGGTAFGYPLVDADAWNGQGRIDWMPDAASALHLSLSSRTRFPTLFERFSSRFGGATSNPDLKAERGTHLELGGSTRLGTVNLEGAVFYSWLNDAIVSFPFIFNGTAVSQSRNVGKGEYYGLEASLNAALTRTVKLGANYTWIERDFDDPSIPAFEATGVPTHKGFAWVEWTPLERLSVIPSLELASDRWTVNQAGTVYYRTGAYADAALRVDYEAIDGVTLSVGARNLFDENVVLTDGFPEPGRRFFASVRFRN